jgi:hypothetical protein
MRSQLCDIRHLRRPLQQQPSRTSDLSLDLAFPHDDWTSVKSLEPLGKLVCEARVDSGIVITVTICVSVGLRKVGRKGRIRFTSYPEM